MNVETIFLIAKIVGWAIATSLVAKALIDVKKNAPKW